MGFLRESEHLTSGSHSFAERDVCEYERLGQLLKKVAEHDPVRLVGQRPDDGGDNGEFYPARFDARQLLRKIANHEQSPIDRGLSPSEYEPVKP
jgi:hypothetical protein